MAEGDDGKTEEPTGKKISEARSEGMVSRSSDLSSAVMLLSGTLFMMLFIGHFSRQLKNLMVVCFESISNFDHLLGNVPLLTIQSYVFLVKLLIPFMLCLALISVVVNLAQYGPLWARKANQFKFSRMFNPKNLMRFFSTGPLIAIPKNMAKMAAVGAMAYYIVHRHYPEFLTLSDQSPMQIVGIMYSISTEMLIKCSVLLLLIGIGDFVYTKQQYRKKLMMTKHEVKDETKAAEGDPRIKGKIRNLRRQMFAKMMMSELPKATVVITNPTFIAIALRYRPGEDKAPLVVAKGKRLIAERIREIARANEIPIIEDKPLARGMYEIAEVGEEIPAEFFAAVAEILATVFSLKPTSDIGIRV